MTHTNPNTPDAAASVTAAQRSTPQPLQVAGVRVINCNACKTNKPETEFSFKNKATGKRNTKCKPCMRAYAKENYQANKPARVAAANKRNVVARARIRAEVAAALEGVSCAACGQAGALDGNDLIVVLPGDESTGGTRLSQLIQGGWAPDRILALVAGATSGTSGSGEVLCRRCLGKRCGAQNRQSIAARERATAPAAAAPALPAIAAAG